MAVAAAGLAAVGVGRAQDPAPGDTAVTEAECRAWVTTLASPAFRGRGTGTPEGYRAATLIAGEFARLGLHPAGPDRRYFQEFTIGDRSARNVLGLQVGSDPALAGEVVLVSAHYDHLWPRVRRDGTELIYPGADDNASGTAALLELAEAFAKADRPPRRSILFAAWDAEENQMPAAAGGLQGSGWWVAHPTVGLERIATMVCMDMLSRDFLSVMDDTLYVVGAERSDALRAIVARVDAATDLHLDLAGTDIVGPRSDHWHFFGRQIPFLFFSTSQNATYHTPKDVAATVRFDKLAAGARVVQAVVRLIADAEARPTFRDEAYVGLEEVRTFVRVGERVLAHRDRFTFAEGAVAQLEAILERGRGFIAAGTVTAADRRAIAVAAGALLLYQIRER